MLASGGGAGDLLVSPINVRWRCSAQAGVVEESKFCLFLVVFPVRCVSSVSPRFYFRRHAFCFLPLAAIVESPNDNFFKYCIMKCPCRIFMIQWINISK
jgi:hypothetical protein